MTRRRLVAGNWKMNGDRAALAELDGIATAAASAADIDVAVAVPATLIALAAAQVPGLAIGAQDVHAADKGAHTGCLSANMVGEAGARFTIVGHSERRADQCETSADVRGKAAAGHRAGLDVILCVGETAAEREAGQAETVVTAQLRDSLPEDADGGWLSIAYEPVWAIGTGKVATVDDIAAIHAVVRAWLDEAIGPAAAARVRILYGGSVTADNAGAIFATANVDGALVGGASLTAGKFVPIVEAATRLVS